MKRHKWADVITAWAEGRDVQCRLTPVDGGKDWVSCGDVLPSIINSSHYEFRIAPEPKYRWVMCQYGTHQYFITEDHRTRAEVTGLINADPVMPIEETRRDE